MGPQSYRINSDSPFYPIIRVSKTNPRSRDYPEVTPRRIVGTAGKFRGEKAICWLLRTKRYSSSLDFTRCRKSRRRDDCAVSISPMIATMRAFTRKFTAPSRSETASMKEQQLRRNDGKSFRRRFPVFLILWLYTTRVLVARFLSMYTLHAHRYNYSANTSSERSQSKSITRERAISFDSIPPHSPWRLCGSVTTETSHGIKRPDINVPAGKTLPFSTHTHLCPTGLNFNLK